MLSDKAIVLCILKILREYSDAEHPLTWKEIQTKLKTDYGLEGKGRDGRSSEGINKRTIYRAIEMLNDPYLGYEIGQKEEKNNIKSFWLIRDTEKDLETGEIQIISDAVATFPFIPKKESEMIHNKLQGQLSVHEKGKVASVFAVRDDVKTINPEVALNVEMLKEAIAKKVKVKFDYYRYEMDKKLHKRREKKYTVNPYGLVYCNGQYYLACIICYGTTLSLYRVDLMKDITLTDYKLDETSKGFSYAEELKKAVYGFVGDDVRINMLVDKSQIGHVIDQFGKNITISEYDDERCRIRLRASKAGFVFWAMQYLRYVEVVEPGEVRQEIIDTLKANRYGI